jgi:hypothetical protein
MGHDLAGKVFVGEVDAGVDDADADAGAGAGGPSGRSPDLLQPPLLGEARVVGGAGGTGDDRDDDRGQRDERECAGSHELSFAFKYSRYGSPEPPGLRR